MSAIILHEITPDNAEKESLFCIKDLKNPGFKAKQLWFEKRYAEGLRMKVLQDELGKKLAFIEYVPANYAWRPVEAPDFMFIHCMYVYAKKDRSMGLGSKLIEACVEDARQNGLSGVCVMTSKGSWITDKRLFEKNGFSQVDQLGRFELLSLKWNKAISDPKLLNWKSELSTYQGWHLLYADQCPWHEKSVKVMQAVAESQGIDMITTTFKSRKDIEKAPSGFGTFALIHDGRLLSDHYISETRFKNILNKELKKN